MIVCMCIKLMFHKIHSFKVKIQWFFSFHRVMILIIYYRKCHCKQLETNHAASCNLVFFPFSDLFSHRIHAYLFLIFLQSCQVFLGLSDLSFLHAFPHVQCIHFHFAFVRSHLRFGQAQSSAVAAVLLGVHTLRCTLARSPWE